jgi:hypothetical protein
LKRALPIVDEALDPQPPEPLVVRIGTERIAVSDGHDGAEARRFANWLLEHGGVEASESQDGPTLRIVIRSHGTSREARLRAEVLEESADFVLGSARPAFARLLVEYACRQTPGRQRLP